MPDVIFRTNHAYDPIIRQHSATKLLAKSSDTMLRYFILRYMFITYATQNIKITDTEALNITATLGDKGS
jgi:hypothetical protein